MIAKLGTLIAGLKSNSILFADVITFIDTYYLHQATAFRNGDNYNESSQNQGSAKVFAFALGNGLNAQDTLHLFAEHYQSVLENPNGSDHQNIRQFMINGWPGINFEGQALIKK